MFIKSEHFLNLVSNEAEEIACKGNMMLFKTDSFSNSLKSWNIKPRFLSRYSSLLLSSIILICFPSIQISPLQSINPAITFKRVVLPHPDGPLITTSPVLGSFKLISFRTRLFPYFLYV